MELNILGPAAFSWLGPSSKAKVPPCKLDSLSAFVRMISQIILLKNNPAISQPRRTRT